MNETDISMRDRIVAAFPPDRYATLFEVRNATGFGQKRRNGYCDALVMGLWPSRGLELAGLEIKTSRSDWLRELRQPEKAEEFLPYCHRWYLVAPADIVQPGELPPTWGHLAPNRNGLCVTVAAPPLVPRPVDVGLLAAICRSAANNWQRHPIYLAAREDMEKDIERRIELGVERERSTLATLAERLADFQLASGVSLFDHYTLGELCRDERTPEYLRAKLRSCLAASDRHVEWRDGQEIGKAVSAVLGGGLATYRAQLQSTLVAFRGSVVAIESGLSGIPKEPT